MNLVNWNDKQIAEAIQNQPSKVETILKYLYHEKGWQKAAVRLVKKLGGNDFDGKDAGQDALLAFYKNVRSGKFLGESALESYYLQIVKFNWFKTLRKQKPTAEYDAQQFSDTETVNLETDYISKEKESYFEKALAQIGERCKKILILKYEEYSLKEIAKKMELKNDNMAKKALYRCRLKFRDFLEKYPNWKNLILDEAR